MFRLVNSTIKFCVNFTMSRIDCENTMTVCAVKKLKGHTGRTFLGILHTARGAEAAFAAEGNKFHVVASGADIHGTAKRSPQFSILSIFSISESLG